MRAILLICRDTKKIEKINTPYSLQREDDVFMVLKHPRWPQGMHLLSAPYRAVDLPKKKATANMRHAPMFRGALSLV